jgi:predicted PurR-regulated permease PerM
MMSINFIFAVQTLEAKVKQIGETLKNYLWNAMHFVVAFFFFLRFSLFLPIFGAARKKSK